MDPRLEQRRRRVAEDRARSNLTRLVRLLVVVAVIAVVAWVLQSPFLSVDRIDVIGAVETDVDSILGRHEIFEGRPMVLLDTDAAEAEIESTAWVVEAEVGRVWPTGVRVVVTERVPVASMRLVDGWHLVAADGTVLEALQTPAEMLPVAELDLLDADDERDALSIAGAGSFFDALPDELRGSSTMRMSPEGLEATVGGFLIRLGGPFEMTEKATVAAGIVQSGLEAGSVITLVAPASPAVLPPGADTESDVTDTTGGEDASTEEGSEEP